MRKWQATHRITFQSRYDALTTTYVMFLDDGDGAGPAYSHVEWDAEVNADWSRDKRGLWHWRDGVTPGGESGVVTVETMTRARRV